MEYVDAKVTVRNIADIFCFFFLFMYLLRLAVYLCNKVTTNLAVFDTFKQSSYFLLFFFFFCCSLFLFIRRHSFFPSPQRQVAVIVKSIIFSVAVRIWFGLLVYWQLLTGHLLMKFYFLVRFDFFFLQKMNCW